LWHHFEIEGCAMPMRRASSRIEMPERLSSEVIRCPKVVCMFEMCLLKRADMRKIEFAG
jgi:hypothetical protein